MEQTQKISENTKEEKIEELPTSNEEDSGSAEPQEPPRGIRRALSLTDEFLANKRRSLDQSVEEPKEKSSKIVAEDEEPSECTPPQEDNENDEDKIEASHISIYASRPHEDEDTKPDQLDDDEENEASDPESEIEDSSDPDVDINV